MLVKEQLHAIVQLAANSPERCEARSLISRHRRWILKHKHLYEGIGSQDSKAGVKRSAPAAGSAKVLNAFRLEQTGQSLRVIDHDGSVYTGSFQSAGYPLTDTVSRVDKGTSTARYAEPPVRKAVQSQPQAVLGQPFTNSQNTLQYFFRVAGTNRSLNQRVVFTGNLINANASVQRAPRCLCACATWTVEHR